MILSDDDILNDLSNHLTLDYYILVPIHLYEDIRYTNYINYIINLENEKNEREFYYEQNINIQEFNNLNNNDG